MKNLSILLVTVSIILFGCDNNSTPVDVSDTSNEAPPAEVASTPSETAPTASSDVSSLVGEYVVEGTNPDGSEYVGQVDIEESTDGTVGLEWTINQDKWTGVGQLTEEGKLYVKYEGGFSGDGTWTLMPNGNLQGTWQADGADQAGTEVWKKQ